MFQIRGHHYIMAYTPDSAVNFLAHVGTDNLSMNTVSAHHPSHQLITTLEPTYPNKTGVKFRDNIQCLLKCNKYVKINTIYNKYVKNIVTDLYFHNYNVVLLSALKACYVLKDIHFLYKNKKSTSLFLLDSRHKISDKIINYIRNSSYFVIHICSQNQPMQKPLNGHEIEYFPQRKDPKKIKHCSHDTFKIISISHKIILCLLLYNSKKNTTFLNIKLCNILAYLFPTIGSPNLDISKHLLELAQKGLIDKNLDVLSEIKPDILRFVYMKSHQYPKLKEFIKDNEFGLSYFHIRVKLNNMKTYSELRNQYQNAMKCKKNKIFISEANIYMIRLNQMPLISINKMSIFNTLYAITGIFKNYDKICLSKTFLLKELQLYSTHKHHFKDYEYIFNNSKIFISIIKYGVIYINAKYCVSLQDDSNLLKNKAKLVL